MTNNKDVGTKTIKVTEPPKIPTLNFGVGKTSIFSGNNNFMPKGSPGAKFNQATFHTQHKGGPAGGK